MSLTTASVAGQVKVWSRPVPGSARRPPRRCGSALPQPVVLPGTYFVFVTDSEYLSEMYDDILCSQGGSFPECDVTKGTPVVLTRGDDTIGIDYLPLPRM